MRIRRFSRMRLRMVAIAWVIAESFSGSTALAQLDGGVVAAGAATISQQGSVTNVMQTTDRAVINWNNFSVPNGHTANFNMPSVNSAVLNRVTSLNNPSLINGAINSNGNVFLVNPSGVIIGSTGVINTAGFTASALDLPNSEFMQGGNLHFRGDSKASIINNGTINTGAGGVALVGHTVINTGTITSQGSISLVSGGSVKLSNGGTYTQADLATINNGISETAGLIKNTGTIRAVGSVNSGGEVYLVNPNGKILHSGVIRATRATTVAAAPGAPTTTKVAGGKVQIEARNSTAEISGSVDVSGDVGGKVSITGSAVQLASATIDASGTNGGGVVQLGGGFQGRDTSITNALATSVDAASTISVNAATGNAGTVIVWSDQATEMAGTITAQSTVSGDGGFVEVSGKETLLLSGLVSTLATSGSHGTLLLDPTEFDINAAGVATPNSIGVVALGTLLGGGNVVIATGAGAGNGDIRVNSAVTYSTNTNFSLLAHGNIRANASIQNSGSGNVALVAGWNGSAGLAPGFVTGANPTTDINLATFQNANVASTAIYGQNNGSVYINNASGTAGVAVGSAGGSTNVFAHDLIIQAGNGANEYAQLGYHNIGAVSQATPTGSLSVALKGNLSILGGTGNNAQAQLGHGGSRDEAGSTATPVNYRSNILVNAVGNVTLTGGSKIHAYAQLGHGGIGANGSHGGTISIVSANSLTVEAKNGVQAYALLGHGGSNITGNMQESPVNSNNISITITGANPGNVEVRGGTNADAFAQIGHGGINITGNGAANSDYLSGSIDINRANSILVQATNDTYARIGNGGSNSTGNIRGNVHLRNVAGDVIIQGGTNSSAFAQIGLGGDVINGNLKGALSINTATNVNVLGGSGNQTFALFGNGGRSYSGNIIGDISFSSLKGTIDVVGGTSSSAFAQIGHGGFNINAAQIGGSTNITSANITINGAKGLNIQAGSANDAYALVGHGGRNTSNLSVASIQGDILISRLARDIEVLGGTATQAYAQLGHGGTRIDGNLSGLITIEEAENLLVQASNGAQAYARLGHGGRLGETHTQGNISISNISNNLNVIGGTQNQAFAQIGHGSLYNNADISSPSDISITNAFNVAIAVAATTPGNAASAVIGHGGSGGAANGLSGNISVQQTGSLAITGKDATTFARIGHAKTTNSLTAVAGDIELRVGINATLTNGNIGHSVPTTTNPVSGYTYVGVGQNTPGMTGAGNLVANSGSRISSATGAQLRLYVPENAAYQLAMGVFLNGVATTSASPSNLMGYANFGNGTPHTPPGQLYGVYLDQRIIYVTATGSSIYGNTPDAVSYDVVGSFYSGDNSTNIGLGNDRNVTSASNVGDYDFDIFLSAGPNQKYQIATNNLDPAGTWTVNQRDITVTAVGGSSTYGQSPLNPGLSATNLASFDAGDPNGVLTGLSNSFGINQTTNAGTHTLIVAGTLTNPNYNVTNKIDGEWIVNQQAITLRAVSISLEYGNGFNFSGTQFATVSGQYHNGDQLQNVIMGSDAHGGGNLPNTAPIGPYQISIQPGSEVFSSGLASNYSFTYETGVFTVVPRDITVTAVGGSSIYGDMPGPMNPGLNATNLASFDAGNPNGVLTGLSNSFGINQTTNAGTHTLTVAGTLTNPNYNVTSTNNGTWIVNQAALTITANNQSKIYGNTLNLAALGSDPTPITGGFTVTGIVANGNGDAVTSVMLTSAGAVDTAPVNSYSIDVTPLSAQGSGLSNYDITYASGIVTVGKRDITVTALGGNSTYGQNPINPGLSATNLASFDAGNPNGVLAGLSNSFGINQYTNAGPHTLTVDGTLTNPNYNVTQRIDGNWIVNQAALTVTANSFSKIYGDTYAFNGTEYTQSGLQNGETINVTLSSAGAVNTAGVAAVAGNPYDITIDSVMGGTANLSNYSVQPFVSGELTVTARNITVTALGGSSTYGSNPLNPGLSATNLASFDAGNPNGVLTGLSNSFGINQYTNAGPNTLTVAGTLTNPNYNVTQTFNGTWIVNQAALTVTANSFSKIYGDTYAFNGTEYTQSGLQNGETINVTLSSTGAVNTAGVAGNPYSITVDSVTGGTANLSNYDLQSFVSGTLTVTPRDITVTALGGNSTYGQNPVNPGLSATNLASFDAGNPNGVLAGLSNSFGINQYTNAGPHTLTVNGTLTNPNYNVTSTSNGTWIVNQAALTITANDRTKTYGQTLILGTTQFTPVGLQNGETIGSVTHASAGAAGTAQVAGSPYAITTSNATGGTFSPNNYTITYSSAGLLTVNKANLIVTANNRNKTYGDNLPLGTTAFTRTGPLFNGNTLTNVTLVASGTPAGNTAAADAGTYAITPSNAVGSGLGNYNITYVNGTLNVGRANLFITPTAQTKVYGDSFTFTGTEFGSSGLKNGDIIAGVTLVSAGTAPTANAGLYSITASNAVGGTYKASNYNTIYVPNLFGFTVTRAPLTVDINDATKVYGDVKTFNGTEFTVGVGQLKNTDTLTNVTIFSAGQVAVAPVGNYDIYGTVPVQGNINLLNYNITVNPGTLSVTPAPLTVTATDQTKIYGNTFTFTGNSPEFSAVGLKNGQNVTSVTIGSAGAPATANVGDYDITISNAQGFGFNPNNYSITYVKGDFDVTARTLIVTANDQSKIYGQAGFALGTTAFTTSGAPSGGLVNGDTVTNVTLTSTGEPVTAPVGSYDILASNATGTGLSNYTIVYEKGTLDVTSRTITVTANDQSKIYGQAGFALGTTAFTTSGAPSGGLVNGDTVTNVTLTSTGEPVTAPVGSYDILASNATGKGLSNYTIVYEKGTLDVTSRTITVTANDQSKIYGTNHNPGTTAFSVALISGNTGLVNGDTVTNVTLTSAGTPAAAPAGTYPIVVSNAVGSGLGNYSITYEDGTLFVGQANLTLIANNQYKTFSWTGFLNGVTGFTPIGLQNGDTIGSVTLTSAATPNTAPIGFYPINISNPTGGTANLANYSITLVPGIFVVGSNFGNFTYDLDDQGKYYWQTLPSLYGSSGSSGGINYSSSGKTTGDKPITGTNSYDVFGGEQ